MARKILNKQRLKFYFPKKILWNPFLWLDRKAKKIPKNILFPLLFCSTTFFLLLKENYNNRKKILGQHIYLKEKQMEIYKLEEFVKQFPDYRDGWLKLAVTYYENGNKEKAKEALLQAKTIDANNEIVLSLEKLLKD